MPHSSWEAAAYAALRRVARRKYLFTTDDVWRAMDVWMFTSPKAKDNRAMGAIMQNGAKAGWIVATKDFQESDMSVCHRRPKRVWRSLTKTRYFAATRKKHKKRKKKK